MHASIEQKKNKYRISYMLFFVCKWIVLVFFLFWSSINSMLFNLDLNRNEGWTIAFALVVLFGYWGFRLFKTEKELGINIKKNEVILPPTKMDIEKTDDVSENIKRYKEAQRKAIDEIKLERSNASWFRSLWH